MKSFPGNQPTDQPTNKGRMEVALPITIDRDRAEVSPIFCSVQEVLSWFLSSKKTKLQRFDLMHHLGIIELCDEFKMCDHFYN